MKSINAFFHQICFINVRRFCFHQDTRTPYPKISKLAEGMYRFQLKVADVLGQSSTAQVDVFVRRPLTTEPRVDAGSDAVVTLPINWAFLDGSKSVDDVGIHKWLWTQLQ